MSSENALALTLAAMAGPEAKPRPGQLQAVEQLRAPGARVLVVQATGWGKSVVYWAATRARRDAGAGPTVVISPLLALMRDQISAAAAAGIRAGTINSANRDDWDTIFDQLGADDLDVLLVSPERLANHNFAATALPLLARAGLLVIDEAHCISDWGDFRPDYQRITRLLLNMDADIPVLATTATANDRVCADVAAQLGQNTTILRGPLTRTSLQLSVVGGLDAAARYAWVSDALNELPGAGIIYTLTVAAAESLTGYLQEAGHNVVAYTGATDTDTRARIEDDLRANTVKAVVATSALGMGYDKPDLAFTIHVGSPGSPVTYYQQVGRAGRALDRAHGILLPAAESDPKIWDYFATATLPDERLAHAVLAALTDTHMSVAELENVTGARRGRLDILLKQLRVDGAVDKSGTSWTATGTPWTYNAEKYRTLLAARREEAGLMSAYARGQRCLMSVLVDALNDPDIGDCGQCSVCTGTLPIVGPAPQSASLDSAHTYLRRQTVTIEARKRWPKDATRSGTVIACATGRALAYADDPGWPAIIAELDTPDAEPSDTLIDAIADLLRRWRPAGRTIVICPDPVTPIRTSGLGKALGTRFGVNVADILTWTGPPPPSRAASGATVTAIEHGIGIAADTTITGPVILLSARDRDRWMLTVAAALLREHGATSVEPLVAHLQP